MVVAFVGCAAPKTLRLAERIPALAADYQPTDGNRMAGPLAELEQRLESWGVAIEDMPPDMPGFGRASRQARTIWLRPELSPDARFEVLAHEAGHLFQAPALDPQTGQLFAEMVGVGVQKFYGSKTAEDVGAAYLSAFKHLFGSYRWMKRDIEYAVACLTGRQPLPEWQ
jgi:hypothetical protein